MKANSHINILLSLTLLGESLKALEFVKGKKIICRKSQEVQRKRHSLSARNLRISKLFSLRFF